MSEEAVILTILEEGYSKKAWHGANLRQSIKGVNAKQAAWRPRPNRHNIWELTLHAAYWKYAVRRKLAGGKRGSFILQGSNFFSRPEKGKADEAAWQRDRSILENEHRALMETAAKLLNQRKSLDNKQLRVRSPRYPEIIAGPLEELEKKGQLVPIVRTKVANLQGKRIDQRMATSSVVILEVRPTATAEGSGLRD